MVDSWQNRIETIERELAALLSPGDVFILVDDDQLRDELLIGHRAIPFLERGGRYWGPPADDETAIREFQRLEEGGVRLIAFAQPAFWWLEHYREFHKYLAMQFRRVLYDADLCVFDLRSSSAGDAAQAYSATTSPIDPAGWERVYLTPMSPVVGPSGAVARAIAELTMVGDLVLETGCGSASASAELALTGRRVALCDFSAPILHRARQLFEVSGCSVPLAVGCDITQPLPWRDRAFDVTWSSGVLEHWTDEELVPIVNEMARITRKRVVSLVPYAGCLLYRFAKHLAEVNGTWPFGREIPRQTLLPVFERAGLVHMRENVLWHEGGARLLGLTDRRWGRVIERWWSSLSEDDPVKHEQGYLLLTVGETAGSRAREDGGDCSLSRQATGDA